MVSNDKIETLCNQFDEALRQTGHIARVVSGNVAPNVIELRLDNTVNLDTVLFSNELGYEVTVHNRGRSVKVWRNK